MPPAPPFSGQGSFVGSGHPPHQSRVPFPMARRLCSRRPGPQQVCFSLLFLWLCVHPPPLTFSSFAPVPSALVGCPPGKRNSLLSWLSGNEARLEDVHCHLSPEPASCRCINLSQQALGPPPPPPPGTCAPHPRPFTGVGQPDRCWFCLTWASVLLCPFAQVLEGFP